MTELFGAIATGIAAAGVYLNNHRRRECFYLWLVSNSITLALHANAGMVALAARDAVFLALAVHGLRQWRAKK